MKDALPYYKKHQGQLATHAQHPITDENDLSTAYTPGVAQPCKLIQQTPQAVHTHTLKGRTVAIITDGSAVLGLGNLKAHASIPVMEGKAVLLKEFAGIDAFPIALNTQDENEIIQTIRHIEPVFGAINLEDINAPKCFHIEQELKKHLNIPIFHDDQHGTAIVVLAALTNALKLTNRTPQDTRVVISGAGAAGVAITKILTEAGVQDIVACDRKGAIHSKRELPEHKQLLATYNKKQRQGSLQEVLREADVFIGVSAPGILNQEDIKAMNDQAIVFALANPDPEIEPEDAHAAGASIVATGRSDHPNQINNVLAFPGIFKGALHAQATDINEEMKQAAAQALATHVQTPTANQLLPNALDKTVVDNVAQAVAQAAKRTGVIRK